MNVMGELASLLGLSALAGVIIGWCIRNFFGGSAKTNRQYAARDADEAVKDARHLRRVLNEKENELQDTKSTLQNLRRKDDSAVSDTRVHVKEINDLKEELATTKKTLLDNQTEFNTYRTETKKDQTELRSELAKYTAGGSSSTERLNEATETVSALRSAVRENDKVIDSLRARVKEADGTVENLRNQLKTSESGRNQIENTSLEYDKKVEVLTRKVEDTTATVEKQKRDYDLMLENKNTDIKNLHSKVEEMTASSSTMKTREYDFTKQAAQYKETENKFKTEIVDLKRVISDRDQALSKARQQTTDLKRVISDRDQALSNARQQTTDLNSQLKSARQHEEQEVQRLQAKLSSSSDSKLKSRSAEVSALNQMLTESANKRDVLQKDLEEKDKGFTRLRAELEDVTTNRDKLLTELDDTKTSHNKLRAAFDDTKASHDKLRAELDDTRTNRDKLHAELKNTAVGHDKLRAEIDEIAASRNKVSTQLGELQSQGNVALEKLQQDMNTLANTRDEYKTVISSLQGQISELTQSKESQLQKLRQELTATSQAKENKYKETTSELTKQNNLLQNDLKTLKSKLLEQTSSIEQQKSDLKKQIEINQRTSAKLEEKDSKLTEFRNKLNLEESEKQRLNRELSDAETLRLTLTERDAELRKAQIELQESASTGGPVQKLLEEQQKQNDTLARALQDRDEELTRLNTQMTNNRLRSKQQQSSIAMLTEEKEAQSALVSSLEKQAENTLQLHTKIARQSTELEDLRARLHERDYSRSTTHTPATNTDQSGSAARATAGSNLQQVETRQSTAAKPRVFVRSDTDTETLTGATGYHSSQRAQYTQDGHRVHRPDGSDDLTLLPGVTQTIASAFNRNGVTTFDQIANWGEREVAHYAERIGVSVQRANNYQWPKASTSILNGTFRKDGQEIGN